MGQPSDNTWEAIGGSARACSVCGRKLKLTEVMECRTVWPGGRREIRGACCRSFFTDRDPGDESEAA